MLSILFGITSLWGYSQPHFSRASSFPGEPRFEEANLTSLEIQLRGGSTSDSYNGKEEKGALFNFLEGNRFADGTPLALTGSYLSTSLTFDAYANIYGGLFCHLYLPAYYTNLEIFTALPQNSGESHPALTASQQQLIPSSYPGRLELGDIAAGLGWTLNYQDTVFLDYIDFTVEADLIIPSSKKVEPIPFAIPIGYNGYIGCHFIVRGSFGVFEWLTLGSSFEGIIFNSKKEAPVAVYTNQEAGIIATTPFTTALRPGSIISASLFAKADHFIHGVSLLIGYSYDHQGKPSSFTLPSQPIPLIGSAGYIPWSMHTLQLRGEVDLATERAPHHPRIGVSYDSVVGGKNIIPTWQLGAYIGYDFN